MEPIRTPYAIIQPYTDQRDRLETAIVVSEHDSAAEAFAELERLRARFQRFNLPLDMVDIVESPCATRSGRNCCRPIT